MILQVVPVSIDVWLVATSTTYLGCLFNNYAIALIQPHRTTLTSEQHHDVPRNDVVWAITLSNHLPPISGINIRIASVTRDPITTLSLSSPFSYLNSFTWFGNTTSIRALCWYHFPVAPLPRYDQVHHDPRCHKRQPYNTSMSSIACMCLYERSYCPCLLARVGSGCVDQQ